MEAQILLTKLRALHQRCPDLERYSPDSREHLAWLGQMHALISRWNASEASSLKGYSDNLWKPQARTQLISRILGILNRAIADLELQLPGGSQELFGAGEPYSFYTRLNDVIGTAMHSIFIIDPYLDPSVFPRYLSNRSGSTRVHLMLAKNVVKVLEPARLYKAQHGDVLEVRQSSELHDRVIFIDGNECWVMGQSLKDAAMAKPTYLLPLAPDVSELKLRIYDSMWARATLLNLH